MRRSWYQEPQKLDRPSPHRDGYDFLDSMRNPEIWAETKKGAEEAGGFTFDLIRDLAKGLVKKQIEELTGVKL
jgi:hypothetical protein